MSTKQIQQIYQYIQSNGNFLSSQKVLKQVEKHPEIVWQLIVKLCSKLKNKNIENAYAQIVYMLNDPDKHQRSSKWLKEYMDIRDLATKLNTSYAVMDYIKPEREKIINLIYKIVEVSKGVNMIKENVDSLIVKDQIMTKEMNKYRILEETTKQTLEELTERKQKDRPLYDEKVNTCSIINQEINSKRQEKLDLISKQKSLKEEITKNEKILDDMRYENENKLIRIEQLKKQIAQNAPEVKKEKRAIQQEYQRLQRQVHGQLELARHRQLKIIQGLESRNIYKSYIIELATKLVQIFTFLDQTKSKYTKIKDENQGFKRRKLLQMSKENQVKDQIHSLQMESYNESSMFDNLIRNRQRSELTFREFIAKVTDVKEEIRSVKERQKKFKELNQTIRENIESIKLKHEEKLKELEGKKKTWDQVVMKSLTQIYTPLQQIKFE